jgi:methylmalonyl-CoA decarboxylase
VLAGDLQNPLERQPATLPLCFQQSGNPGSTHIALAQILEGRKRSVRVCVGGLSVWLIIHVINLNRRQPLVIAWTPRRELGSYPLWYTEPSHALSPERQIMTLIQAELQARVGTLAFDHYAKRNALGVDLIAEMLDHLDEFARNEVGAVVIRSASGQPVWSSGHDVNELPLADLDPLPYNEPLEQLLRAVKRFPAPVIAMVHGSVWGAAFDLVMACDIVLSDETGAFAITPAKLGLPYNTNGFLNFISRAPLGIVKEMFFTADPISAQRALRAGFVNQVIPEAELEGRTYAMARTIASRSAAAVAAAKQAMHELSDAVMISPDTYERLHGLRREAYFGPEYHEGIQAFLQKRTPDFDAARARAGGAGSGHRDASPTPE